MPFIFDGYFDSRSDPGAVGFHSYKLHGDLVVAISQTFENAEGMCISRSSPAGTSRDVFVAVIAQVGEGDAVPIVEFTNARGSADVYE